MMDEVMRDIGSGCDDMQVVNLSASGLRRTVIYEVLVFLKLNVFHSKASSLL